MSVARTTKRNGILFVHARHIRVEDHVIFESGSWQPDDVSKASTVKFKKIVIGSLVE